MKTFIIPRDGLFNLIDLWAKDKEVVAPVRHENFTKFSRIRSAAEIIWQGPQTVLPPKKYFHPPRENLFRFGLSGGDIKVEDGLEVKDRILFGVHPCDLNAIYLLDQVFSEKNPDEYYLNKRNSAVIVGVECLSRCSDEAICIRMDGLAPRDRFDIFLTDVGDRFFVHTATEKGEDLIKDIAKPARLHNKKHLKEILKKRDKLFDRETPKLLSRYKDLPKLMKESYDSPEWAERGEKDYSCGSCNAVCPTCYCFDVQEDVKIDCRSGIRKRLWDGCMLGDFSKVASGENFREEAKDRLRHRTYRKLYYLFSKWGQSFCTGCGRCIKACLTKIVNPLEIANALYTRNSKNK